MARKFSQGATGKAIVGNFYIGFARGGTIPIGWNKMDKGFAPVFTQIPNTFPELNRGYLRASGLNQMGTVGGDRTHSHAYTLDKATSEVPASPIANGHAFLSAGVSKVSIHQDVSEPPIGDTSFSLHTHGTDITQSAWNDHAHALSVEDVIEPSTASLPASFGIDWVGKVLNQKELDAFPKGSVLGFWNDKRNNLLGNIPQGWALCDGALITPDLLTKFISPGGGGTTQHNHIKGGINSQGNSTGDHTHGFTFTGTIGSVLAAIAGGIPVLMNTFPHTHSTLSTDGDHDHDGATTEALREVTADQKANLPDFVDIPFLMKVVDSTEPLTGVPTDLHVFYFDGFAGAPSTPSGFTVESFADGLMLYGRRVDDPDFGLQGGPFFADTHSHTSGVLRFATAGVHAHGSNLSNASGGCILNHRVIPGSTAIPICLHQHTATIVSAGGHAHSDVLLGLFTGNHKPECFDLKAIKRS